MKLTICSEFDSLFSFLTIINIFEFNLFKHTTGLTTTQNSDFTNYTYDALSRVITVINPDGNTSNVKFDNWNITAYDENSHRKMYVTDAYGRIVNVLGDFYDN